MQLQTNMWSNGKVALEEKYCHPIYLCCPHEDMSEILSLKYDKGDFCGCKYELRYGRNGKVAQVILGENYNLNILPSNIK